MKARFLATRPKNQTTIQTTETRRKRPSKTRRRRILGVFISGVLIVGVLIAGLNHTKAATNVGGTFSYPVAFVDKTSVDLHWTHPDPIYDTYVISRDGHQIFTTGTSVTFYRDTGLTEGQTYTYEITAIDEDDGYTLRASQNATTGQIHGTLYQDKIWPADTYSLSGNIDILPGVTFEIQSGSIINDANGFSRISDLAGGELHITDSTVHTDMSVGTANSVVSDVIFSGCILFYERSDEFNTTNIFTNGAILHIGSGLPTIRSQMFEKGAAVVVEGSALATIEQCIFEQAQVSVENGGSAIITGNVFRLGGSTDDDPDPAVLVSSSGDVDILNNHFDDADILLDAYVTGNVNIRNNTMQGGPQTWAGIRIKSGTPEITDNVIYRYSTGIHYNLGNKPDGGTATGNTIALNYTGIDIDGASTPLINDNCIAGNREGVYASPLDHDVDMTGNWWGAASGPYHSTNPNGAGNRVYGDTVDFSGWLTTDNCQAGDVVITDMEAVQAIGSDLDWVSQKLVPLPAVAGRETIVRAYADAPVGAVSGVEGKLRAYRDGAYLGEIDSENTIRIEPKVPLETQRSNLKEGAVYFELPAEWTTAGTLTYTVTLNPDENPVELSTSNNVMTNTVDFIEQPPFRIAYVPILYKPGGGSKGVPPSVGLIVKGHVFLQSILPYANVEMGLFSPLTWKKQMQGADEHDEWTRGGELLNILSVILIQWNLTHPPAERFDQIIGVFPGSALEMISSGEADSRWGGDDEPNMGLGIASYCWASGDCFAHEIGHNLGLHHTNVQGKDCYAPDIESYWLQHYSDNTIQNFGYYDTRNELVPATTPDIMSYCQDAWVSPLHWKMLLNTRGVPQPPYEGEVPVTDPSLAATRSTTAAAETTYLLVRGWTSIEGVTEFLPFWTATTTDFPLWTPDNGTDYCVRMKDGDGNIIAEKCMDAIFADPEANAWRITKHMLVALPVPAGYTAQNADGTLANIAEISVFSNKFQQDVAILQPSEHQPTVSWVNPAPGTVLTQDTEIRWTGADADGDPLVYSVFYRPASDAPWIPLIVDTAKNSYPVALQELPAGSAGQFKVAASDGYHVVEAISGAVSVPERSPGVYLLSPVTDETYTPEVYLSGYGYHPDYGLLPGESLTWNSNRDGVLGSGEALTVTLSPGEHLITLTGSYEGQTTTTGVSITVNAEATAITGLAIIGPDEVTTGIPVTLQASLTSGTDVSYTWNFGDGTTATGKTVTHIFPIAWYEHTYNVQLTAVNPLSQRMAYKNVTITMNQVFLPVIVR